MVCDWEGERYCGHTINWDYEGRAVHISMPSYRIKALSRFNHPTPSKPQNQLYTHIKPNYGAKTQHATAEVLEDRVTVNPKETHYLSL